ncbi:MAG: transposase [Pseudomonas stutzeri]|nr:transposase [Stutzerimonas stutzeri]
MEMRYSSHRLRKGRYSGAGQIYLVTTATHARTPVFAQLAVARLLINTIREDAKRGSHTTLAFVVMPDHLHWLLQLHHDSLPSLVGRVKSITARRLGGRVWQNGFHDRAVRHDDDLLSLARYVVANPLRAGLVERIGDYPHWDAIWM